MIIVESFFIMYFNKYGAVLVVIQLERCRSYGARGFLYL
jgi:hypothetical protein